MKTLLGFISFGILLITTATADDGIKRNEGEKLLPFAFDSQRRAECGGTFRSDENTLSFPGIPGESLIGGETCVWTIHLESTRDFRFNFTQFDVNSDDAGCSSAGVRLYSLSNLVPPGELQNELFCSGRPPSDSGFFLGGNVAALVVYSTANNSDVGSGFTLTWKGASFDPLLTKHVSSFSSVESGVVSYPVIGNYEPNSVATWAVTTEQGRKSDLLVDKLDVEECPNSDPCTCDALILYEVEERGVLSENTRFCANSSVTIERVGVADRFLLAFFSDFNESPGGTGFSAKYFPTTTTTSTPAPTTTNPTTPPTTEPSTFPTTDPTTLSTAEPTTPEPETTPCGGVFSEPSGVISFHLNSNYANFERCVWTLQHPQATAYIFNLTEYFVSDSFDGLLISTLYSFRRAGYNTDANITNYRPRESSFTLSGDVAILTFYSDASITSRGFAINYEAVIRSVADPRTGIILQETSSLIDYPPSGSVYPDNDLATFVFSPNFKFNGDLTNFADYKRKELEINCNDWLNVASFVRTESGGMEWAPFSTNSVICNETVSTALYGSPDMLLFVFKADGSRRYSGFQLNFYTKPNHSTDISI